MRFKKPGIYFTDFQKVVLDYQLNEHIEFLRFFNTIYHELDTKNSGYLFEIDFRELIFRMIQSCSDHLANLGSSPEIN